MCELLIKCSENSEQLNIVFDLWCEQFSSV